MKYHYYIILLFIIKPSIVVADGADFSFYLRGGYDPHCEYYSSSSGSELGGLDNVQEGYNLSGEIIYYKPGSELFKIGVGAGYQSPRNKTADPDEGKFYFIPYYFSLYFAPLPKLRGDNSLFFKLEFGRNYFNGDSVYRKWKPQSGVHFGIGVGTTINRRFIVDVKWTSNTGSLRQPPVNEHSIAVFTTSLSLGVILF